MGIHCDTIIVWWALPTVPITERLEGIMDQFDGVALLGSARRKPMVFDFSGDRDDRIVV